PRQSLRARLQHERGGGDGLAGQRRLPYAVQVLRDSGSTGCDIEMKFVWLAGLAGIAVLAVGAMTGAVVKQAPQSAACRAPDRSEVHIAGGTFQMGSAEYY